ncbi:MAG: hypothetical protein ACRD3J_30120 [Thermoanaerobaculia bacterium]
MDADGRMEDFDRRLRRIEIRLDGLEHARDVQTEGSLPEEPSSTAEETAPIIDLSLIGISLLILGGAFLLRAATDSATVSKPAGVVLGLLYSMAWIGVAIRGALRGRQRAAIYLASTAAVIAYPILWEATTRFGVLSANIAALVLAVLSIGLIEAGRRYSIPSLGWIAAAGATCDALLLAFATKELIPFFIELTVISAAAFALRANVAGWVLAIESDLLALLLILLTLLDPSNDGRAAVTACLLLSAVIWIAVSPRAMFQGAAASLLGIAGSSVLVLSPAWRTILLSVAALLAAEIARRSATRSTAITFTVQSAAFAIIAAIGSGLLPFAGAALVSRGEAIEIPVAALIGAAIGLAAFLRERNVVLLAIAVCAVTSLAIYAASSAIGSASEGVHALLGTIVLAAVSVALAITGRFAHVAAASQLAIALLLLTGAKVIAQDLRTGTAAMMFIALAVYGSAMLAIAKTRRSAIGPNTTR